MTSWPTHYFNWVTTFRTADVSSADRQLAVELSWVELCRYKRGFSLRKCTIFNCTSCGNATRTVELHTHLYLLFILLRRFFYIRRFAETHWVRSPTQQIFVCGRLQQLLAADTCGFTKRSLTYGAITAVRSRQSCNNRKSTFRTKLPFVWLITSLSVFRERSLTTYICIFWSYAVG